MSSIWTETVSAPHFDALKGDLKTDVLIIGGGMAGLLCAHALTEAGVDCVLLEAERICGGITKNTTAKITLQHGLLYGKMIRRFGEERAALYLSAQKEAIERYRVLASTHPCDFEEKDAYVYSLKSRERIEQEVDAYRRLGETAEFAETLPLPFPVAGAVKVAHQAQFHPLKFAYAIAQGLPIYEHTKVLELLPDGARTPYGKVTAKKTVVATHFPFLNKHGGYFLKLYQHRSYVLALRGAPDVRGMYVDESDTGLSFRNYGELLLLGGGGHKTGKQGGAWRELSDFAARHYPMAKEVLRTATQDCMTLDDVPYIGRYASGTRGLYVATGFNKWGMTSSMVAATLLCDLLQDKENAYAEVFSPDRSILRPRLFSNAFSSLVGLLTPTVPRCPHMGCALKYNREEHSWDCPCHGSRFTEEGNLIDNPATDGKKHGIG